MPARTGFRLVFISSLLRKLSARKPKRFCWFYSRSILIICLLTKLIGQDLNYSRFYFRLHSRWQVRNESCVFNVHFTCLGNTLIHKFLYTYLRSYNGTSKHPGCESKQTVEPTQPWNMSRTGRWSCNLLWRMPKTNNSHADLSPTFYLIRLFPTVSHNNVTCYKLPAFFFNYPFFYTCYCTGKKCKFISEPLFVFTMPAKLRFTLICGEIIIMRYALYTTARALRCPHYLKIVLVSAPKNERTRI